MKKGIILGLMALFIAGCSNQHFVPVVSLNVNGVHVTYGAGSGSSSGATKSNLGFDIKDACSILKKNPSWKDSLKKVEKKWKTPPHVVMAIIRKESSFKHDARPIKNGKRLSSALGFAQALDGTWKTYKDSTGNRKHRRDNFEHATNFIGWYTEVTRKKNGVSKWDPYNQYRNYYLGWGGYQNKKLRNQRDLKKWASQVESYAASYKKQLKRCY